MLEKILEKVRENLKGSYNTNPYNTLEKLKESGYFVECVEREIGHVAFFEFDYEMTVEEESKLVEAFFN